MTCELMEIGAFGKAELVDLSSRTDRLSSNQYPQPQVKRFWLLLLLSLSKNKLASMDYNYVLLAKPWKIQWTSSHIHARERCRALLLRCAAWEFPTNLSSSLSLSCPMYFYNTCNLFHKTFFIIIITEYHLKMNFG